MLANFMCGEFKSTLDAKGRMNFPVKLREIFGESFIISKTLENEIKCITVYSVEEWRQMVERIQRLPQTKTAGIQRFLFGSAYEIEPDKQGRVLIPAPLREYAGLVTDVVIVGLSGRAEIWDKAKWDELNNTQDTQSLVDIAMELGI